MRAELATVYAGLSNKRNEMQMHLQDVLPLGGGAFRVVAAVNAVHDEAQFAECIARETDGAARLIPGSMAARGRIVAGIAVANKRSRPLDGSFKMMSSCTASDDRGILWNVVDDGSGKRAILLENADDLEAMFRERVATRRVVANPSEGRGIAMAAVASGDVVRYVDVDKGETQCAIAFVVNGELIGVNAQGNRHRIDRHSVMQATSADQLNPGAGRLQQEVAGSSLSPEELDTAIAFLGKCGILSDAMAERMRTVAGMPSPAA